MTPSINITSAQEKESERERRRDLHVGVIARCINWHVIATCNEIRWIKKEPLTHLRRRILFELDMRMCFDATKNHFTHCSLQVANMLIYNNFPGIYV